LGEGKVEDLIMTHFINPIWHCRIILQKLQKLELHPSAGRRRGWACWHTDKGSLYIPEQKLQQIRVPSNLIVGNLFLKGHTQCTGVIHPRVPKGGSKPTGVARPSPRGLKEAPRG